MNIIIMCNNVASHMICDGIPVRMDGHSWFLGCTVPWLYSSTVLRFYSSMVLRFYGSTVPWFYSSMVLRFYGSSYSSTVP